MDTLHDKVAIDIDIDIDDDGIAVLAGDLSERGAAALPQRADVANRQAFEHVRGAALQRFGRVAFVVSGPHRLPNSRKPL